MAAITCAFGISNIAACRAHAGLPDSAEVSGVIT